MKIECQKISFTGEAAKEEKGELVCTQPFPSMPIGFFNDPDKKKYKQNID